MEDAVRSWLFELNTGVAPPHFYDSNSDFRFVADGCELFMCRFYLRLLNITEEGKVWKGLTAQ